MEIDSKIQYNTIQYNIRLLTIANMLQLSLKLHTYSNQYTLT